jgi:hypothetical protein
LFKYLVFLNFIFILSLNSSVFSPVVRRFQKGQLILKSSDEFKKIYNSFNLNKNIFVKKEVLSKFNNLDLDEVFFSLSHYVDYRFLDEEVSLLSNFLLKNLDNKTYIKNISKTYYKGIKSTKTYEEINKFLNLNFSNLNRYEIEKLCMKITMSNNVSDLMGASIVNEIFKINLGRFSLQEIKFLEQKNALNILFYDLTENQYRTFFDNISKISSNVVYKVRKAEMFELLLKEKVNEQVLYHIAEKNLLKRLYPNLDNINFETKRKLYESFNSFFRKSSDQRIEEIINYALNKTNFSDDRLYAFFWFSSDIFSQNFMKAFPNDYLDYIKFLCLNNYYKDLRYVYGVLKTEPDILKILKSNNFFENYNDNLYYFMVLMSEEKNFLKLKNAKDLNEKKIIIKNLKEEILKEKITSLFPFQSN